MHAFRQFFLLRLHFFPPIDSIMASHPRVEKKNQRTLILNLPASVHFDSAHSLDSAQLKFAWQPTCHHS